MKIAVCDDNKNDLNEISKYIKMYCKKHHYMVSIYKYENAEALLACYDKEMFDIVILDIFMKGISGIDAARQIRKLNRPCVIIFITISDNHSLDAYNVDGLAYILKPLKEESINHVLDRCSAEFLKSSRFITLPTGRRGSVDLPLANIIYIEVYSKELYIHTGKQKIIINHISLAEIQDKLGGDPFYRCHRSYIVNMNYIDSIKNGEIIMKNGDKINIPIRKYTEFQMVYGEYLTKSLKEKMV